MISAEVNQVKPLISNPQDLLYLNFDMRWLQPGGPFCGHGPALPV
jgi:hypothetical protein